ncbi:MULTISPECIES: hypothetical protein [unclassified Mesorhizobium]|uniref:hypothetical protein n=1 Tax=unclassified Mesorhizobium TaxID=325217 RepID=UPI001093E22D|nr:MULTISPECIES: hypothetical protein [unclassified Mesorhizobium]TGS46405.1 hypothetical protein EN825_12455 [Mesorhizobium sp. M8A.F.Ca.ET.182.01.1.1]TGS81862.1 hypothetical protein EN824_12690 [Mesorhizobium sp. M8A.F.Ca.ET.181.01.1.1]
MEHAPFEKATLGFSDIPSVIAAASAYCVVLSVARQVGFFWQIDLKLLTFFSVSDVIANSLQFVPILAAIYAVGIFLRRADVGVPKFISIPFNVVFQPNGNHAFGIKVGLFLIALAIIFSTYWPIVIVFTFLQTLSDFYGWAQQRGILEKHPLKHEIFMSVWLVISVAFTGAVEANGDIAHFRANYIIKLRDGDTKEYNLLRMTSRYVIVMDEKYVVSALDVSDVAVLSKKKQLKLEPFIDATQVWHWIIRRFIDEERPPDRRDE